MGTEFYLIAVVMLLIFAVFDIIVGVVNDAVNFLNSSIGSKVAPFVVIMVIASLGILAGVTFSGGMMEVARKGIFHPQFFTMPELVMIFMAVMLTDIILLDLFNSNGLPTSTTVSIVFELLGAAVALSLFKIMNTQGNTLSLGEYINTSKAMAIIFGILLSIVVAFCCGAVVQFISRMIFTFDYMKKLKRYGALWGGVAMAAITFFILIKGVKGATFMTSEATEYITSHTLLILFYIFIISAVILQILISFFRVNILKVIVLVGTFALAMAFASNDLVNFIGVPLAGMYSYIAAMGSADPLNITMEALSKKVHTPTYLMLIAGAVMVLTLWFSKKARSVTETEISLGQQDEGTERFESIWLSRMIVGSVDSIFGYLKGLVPGSIRVYVSNRVEPQNKNNIIVQGDNKPSFDMVRASVNLMVASALISLATSMKLPLSTTYVTFMVAMGTSFSDQAWGRESAVYRVTGVLTVVGGWFMTAFIAFVTAFIFANIIQRFPVAGIVLIMAFTGFMIWKNHQKHKGRAKEKEKAEVFNLKKITDPNSALSNTFEHLAHLLKELRESFNITMEALFIEDMEKLRQERKKRKHIQVWINIIMANIFKVLRLLQKDQADISYKYAQTIRRLQKLSDGQRDIVNRSYMHVANKHKGLLDVQIEELKTIKTTMLDILFKVEESFHARDLSNYQNILDQYNYMRELADRINQDQLKRIRDDESKTRLSILYYAIIGNCIMIAKQNIKLLEIFNESFKIDDNLMNADDIDTA